MRRAEKKTVFHNALRPEKTRILKMYFHLRGRETGGNKERPGESRMKVREKVDDFFEIFAHVEGLRIGRISIIVRKTSA